jgi:DNA-binding beta-propeller fold protein YncE
MMMELALYSGRYERERTGGLKPNLIGAAVILTLFFLSGIASLPFASAASPPSYDGSIPVGSDAEDIVYSTVSQEMYAYNVADQTVSVISGTTVVATIPLPGYPHSIAYDSQNGYVYTVDSCNCPNNLLSEIDTATNALVGNVALPVSNSNYADVLVFDPANGYLYFNDLGGDVVVFGPSCGCIVTTIPLGPNSDYITAIAYNRANDTVYVASYGSDSLHTIVSVISSFTNRIVGTVSLPGPAHPVFGMSYSPLTQEMYAVNYKVRVGSVSILSGTQLVTTVRLDYAEAYGVRFDPADGYVWITEINGEIALIDSSNQLAGTIFAPLQYGYPLLLAAYNPSSTQMYIANGYNDVVLVFNS